MQRRLGITAPWASPRTEWSDRWDQQAALDHAENYEPALLLNLAEAEVLIAMPLITDYERKVVPLTPTSIPAPTISKRAHLNCAPFSSAI